MEPLTLAAGAGAVYLLAKMFGKKPAPKGGTPEQTDAGGFQAFAPGAQDKAWYCATSILWTPAGKLGGADYFTGFAGSGDSDAQRSANDQWLRGAMGQGFVPLVSDKIVIPQQGEAYRLVFAPAGFKPSVVPASWGPLLQLYAPGQGAAGGAGPGLPADGDPYSEIQDAELRTAVRNAAQSDTAALRDLDTLADQLDKAGYARSAAAIRERRKNLAILRSQAAKQAGGWLYVVRTGDLPINVAQWYGGQKPGVLGQMVKLNPKIAAATQSAPKGWGGWVDGAEVLLPIEWPDPSLKALPPLAQGGGKPPAPGGKPSDAGGGSTGITTTPWGPYTPGQPLPPGTLPVQYPGSEAYPVPQGSTAPNGFIWGPPWIGKWTPPKPGGIDPYTDIDNGPNPMSTDSTEGSP